MDVFLLWLLALVPPVALAVAGGRLARRGSPTGTSIAAYWAVGLALTVALGPVVIAAAGPLAAGASTAAGGGLWLAALAALTGAGLTFIATVTLGVELLFTLGRRASAPG